MSATLNLRNLASGDRVWLADGTKGRVSDPPYEQTYDIDYVRVDLDLPGEHGTRLFHMRGEHCLGFFSYIVKVVRAPKAKAKSTPKSRKKYAWRVVVHCGSRAHAREARANIDDGLRNLSIERIEV